MLTAIRVAQGTGQQTARTMVEAKLQLKERLSHSKSRSERVVEIETTDKLTDPQIVAKVKDHYRIDR